MKKYIVSLLLLVFFAGTAFSQGWQRTYGGGGQDAANDVALTPDGGYIIAGYYGANNRIQMIKVDADGLRQWSRTYTPEFFQGGTGVVVTKDTGLLVLGWVSSSLGGARNMVLIKTDMSGNPLWTRQYGSSMLHEDSRDLLELPNGDLLITGVRNDLSGASDVMVIRTDAQGNVKWTKYYGEAAEDEIGIAATVLPDGNIALLCHKKSQGDLWLQVIDADGNLVWQNIYEIPDAQGATAEETPRGIAVSPDGNLILAGFTNVVPNGGAGFLLKVSTTGTHDTLWSKAIPNTDFYSVAFAPDGNLFATGLRELSLTSQDLLIGKYSANGGAPLWETLAGRGGPDQGYAVLATPDGGAIAAGSSYEFVTLTEELPYLVKTDGMGLVFTTLVQANIFLDANNNCIRDADELQGLRDWILRVEGNGLTRYGVSAANGRIELLVDTGAYNLTLITPNNYWESCEPVVVIDVPEFFDTLSVDIPVKPAVICPRNEVDIATPALRQCADNVYSIRMCNSGTTASIDTRVTVELDDRMTLTASSLPLIQQQGNVYTFNLGTVTPGACRTFTVTAFLSCDVTAGSAVCVNAHVYPDSFCMPGAWNGAFLQVIGRCEQDTVRFDVRNTGSGPSQGPHEFVIVEDIILLTPLDMPLSFSSIGADDEITDVWTAPADGKTYRMIASQVPDYPGTSFPTAAVEGCASDTSAGNNTGFYTMFTQDDEDPFVEYDCQESNELSYNPVFLKRGHPKGYGTQHFVRGDHDLEYLIYFENTGDDTVNQVIIRDTLSALLDPASVLPGSSSHAYQFQVYGTGIVQFTLPNITLLPAGTGGSSSSGFVQFRVAPKAFATPEEGCNSPIYNSAAVYFDFNAPVITNEIFHTVCPFDSFITVKTQDIKMPGATVRFAPNPFSDYTYVDIQGVTAQTFRIEIFDIQGQLLFNQNYPTPTFRLFRNALPSGAFFYRIAADGRPVAAGKLLIR